MTSPKSPSAVLVYVGLVLGAVITLAPFVLGLLTSFTSAHQFATGTPLAWPRPPTLANYADLGGAGFGRALAVTTLMTAVILLGQLTFSVLAAYAFARLRFPGRDALFWVYIATLMVPGSVTVVPLYLMMAQLGLRNTFWALVLPFVFGSPYAIFLLRQYFRAIPDDLINAAYLDGANTLDVIVHVVLPSSRPVLVTLMLITVVSQWHHFMWPLVITSGTKWQVLTVATAALQSRYNAQWTLVMAATAVAIVPLLVLFVMFPAAHRPLDRRHGAEMSCGPGFPRCSHWLWCWSLRCWPRRRCCWTSRPGRAAARPWSPFGCGTSRSPRRIDSRSRRSRRTHPDIEVHTHVVSYSTYFNTLRTDVAGGSADDIFWISNAYLAGYADSGRLMDIGKTLGAGAASAWEPSVVEQFTRGGTLWAVPQLTDAGIALYYNADLLAAAGVDPAELAALRWSPDGGDTLRPLLARLTVDADGHTAATPGFDAGRIRQWAYNAANDAQGIYLNYIGSAGGVFQNGDRFAFDNPGAIEAFTYLVRLINGDHVAPPASDTNDNGDFSRNQFLAGRMALFQSGTYNLAAVADQAGFRWGVAMLPAGPKGRVSVTNGIAAAGNSASAHPDAVRQVLAWMGSNEGNQYVGRHGSAIPAVRSAQRVYFDYWAAQGRRRRGRSSRY